MELDKEIENLEKLAVQLEPDRYERAEIAQQAGDYIDQFIEMLPEMPGFVTGELNELGSFEVGEEGKPIEKLLKILKDEVDTVGINSASGVHLGYIPGGGLWTSAIADMLVAATNRYAGIAYSSPGAVKIENQMIEWLSEMVGYPAEAHGNLTSGGSVANLIAIKTARDLHRINSDNVKKAVVYFTQQVHHCIHKALNMTGLHEAVLRPVPLNEKYQMNVANLQKQMAEDRANGLKPFLVVATAGTTDTGAIDPLDKIADLCEEYNVWFHIDAAYGGFFLLVDEMKEKFKGIERSDSVVVDPHKTLFIPYGSGVVLVRDREALLASNAYQASYMKDAHGQEDISPSDTSFELSRHFRGLRMWLPLHLHGLRPFRSNLREKLLLSRYFHREIAALGFETGPEPELSVSIFRYPEAGNNLNQRIVDALHEDGRVFFSSTSIDGELWIRCAVVSHRTHLREINLALEMVEETVAKVLKNQERFARP